MIVARQLPETGKITSTTLRLPPRLSNAADCSADELQIV
jgi:hypothetical protein